MTLTAQLTMGQNHDTPSGTKDVFVFVMFAHKKDMNWTRLHKQTEKTLFAYKNAFCAGNKTQVAEIIINNISHIIGLWIFFSAMQATSLLAVSHEAQKKAFYCLSKW